MEVWAQYSPPQDRGHRHHRYPSSCQTVQKASFSLRPGASVFSSLHIYPIDADIEVWPWEALHGVSLPLFGSSRACPLGLGLSGNLSRGSCSSGMSRISSRNLKGHESCWSWPETAFGFGELFVPGNSAEFASPCRMTLALRLFGLVVPAAFVRFPLFFQPDHCF